VLSQLKEREPRYRNIREKVLRDAKRAEQVSTLTPAEAASTLGTSSGAAPKRKGAAAAGDGEVVEPVAVGSATTPRSQTRPAAKTSKGARARTGSKKAKRRKRR
ncbi:MAG: hypothetical protein M3290_10625, partial [Actinomycetota bacterium]|nr:hypothetical protein [Actinomycetota bacterium]